MLTLCFGDCVRFFGMSHHMIESKYKTECKDKVCTNEIFVGYHLVQVFKIIIFTMSILISCKYIHFAVETFHCIQNMQILKTFTKGF